MLSRFFKPLLAVVLGATLASTAVFAREMRPPEPALWQIRTGESTVYLFGSIHMLPRGWPWRTKAIDRAIRSSDEFVFETALTPKQIEKMRLFIRDNGALPRGQQLSHMLSPKGLKDFNKAISMTPLDAASVNAMRPWLALMVLGDYQVQKGRLRGFVEEGVDYTIEQEAHETGKRVRLLETAESQFEVLIRTVPDDDIKRFEADVHELLEGDDKYRRLLEGWTAGSQAELANVLAAEAVRDPEEKQLLMDKRNRNWLPQSEHMMSSKETIFITVGAAHLVGPGSVLEMLCARGWNVQRIKTGPSAPPPTCPAPTSPASTASLRT